MENYLYINTINTEKLRESVCVRGRDKRRQTDMTERQGRLRMKGKKTKRQGRQTVSWVWAHREKYRKEENQKKSINE